MAAAAAQVVSGGLEAERGKYRENGEKKEGTHEDEEEQERRKATGRSSPTIRMMNEACADVVSPSRSISCATVLVSHNLIACVLECVKFFFWCFFLFVCFRGLFLLPSWYQTGISFFTLHKLKT